jgi:hypothetical protein
MSLQAQGQFYLLAEQRARIALNELHLDMG